MENIFIWIRLKLYGRLEEGSLGSLRRGVRQLFPRRRALQPGPNNDIPPPRPGPKRRCRLRRELNSVYAWRGGAGPAGGRRGEEAGPNNLPSHIHSRGPLVRPCILGRRPRPSRSRPLNLAYQLRRRGRGGPCLRRIGGVRAAAPQRRRPHARHKLLEHRRRRDSRSLFNTPSWPPPPAPLCSTPSSPRWP